MRGKYSECDGDELRDAADSLVWLTSIVSVR